MPDTGIRQIPYDEKLTSGAKSGYDSRRSGEDEWTIKVIYLKSFAVGASAFALYVGCVMAFMLLKPDYEGTYFRVSHFHHFLSLGVFTFCMGFLLMFHRLSK
jgi:hypothetical protein